MAIIDEEFDRVAERLGADYEIGTTGAFTRFETQGSMPTVPFVVIQSQGRSLAPASTSTAKAIEEWRPEVIVLAGIGGGIVRSSDGRISATDGPQPGDVVVGEYVHYADYTKNVPSGTLMRYFPVDQPSNALVQQIAIPMKHKKDWRDRIETPRPFGDPDLVPSLFSGEVIHVEGLAGDPNNPHQRWYLDRFDNAVCVDMESIGVARALHDARSDVHYNPRWMCVRVISDRVAHLPDDGSQAAGTASDPESVGIQLDQFDNNEERGAWKPYSVDVLGCFTSQLVERLLHDPRPRSKSDPGARSLSDWVS